MRAILGSYDSELTQAEYSPQLTQRMWEAEDMVQKVHAHSSEMEVGVHHGQVGTMGAAMGVVLLCPAWLRVGHLVTGGFQAAPAAEVRVGASGLCLAVARCLENSLCRVAMWSLWPPAPSLHVLV